MGTVTDVTGAVVPDAKVTATGSTVSRGLDTTTDADGNYQFARLPIGTYTISVSKTGFSTVRQANIEVRLGSQISFSPKLEVGQTTQVVEVTDVGLLLDTTSSRTSTNITQAQFENVPRGRSFNSILQMAPGVRYEPKGGNAGVGGFQIDGASGSENTYIIDGVDVSDVRRGSLRPNNAIPLEFVQEVQIKSGGFEAEYGGATGGVINVATRSGSNTYHGQAFFEWTNDNLNARDRGFWQRGTPASTAEFIAPREDNYRIWWPGGTVAGPIIRDRLFFFGSLAPQMQKTLRNVSYRTAGERVFEQEQTSWYGLGRLDYAASSKLQLNGSYIWSPQKINGYLPNRDPRLSPPSNDLSIQGGYTQAQSVSGSAVYSASPNVVLSARYGYRYLNDKLGNSGLTGNYGLSGDPYVVYRNSAVGIAGVPAALQQPNNYSNVSSTFGIEKDITTRNNLYLDGTWIVGRHTLKGGYQLNRLHNEVADDFTNGNFLVYWNDTFSRGSVQGARGQYGYYIWEDGVRHTGSVNSRNQGFFLQDTWRVNSRLTLNMGIRLESEYLPPFLQEQNGVQIGNPVTFDWSEKIAPRLGAAWDVMGDGKWRLAASFGIFYDVLKYELARGSFGSDYWVSHVYRLDNPNVLSLSKTNPGVLGTKIIEFNNRTLPINEQGQIEGIDPDIKPYSSREFSINLDRQLGPRLIGGIRYTRKDLLQAVEDIGILVDDSEEYLTGNPGSGLTRKEGSVFARKTPNGETFLVPEPVRQYDAVEFRLQGQMARLNFIGSYTWSRLWGNYSGAANSDESGRSDPGVSRAFDLPYYYFDASGSQETVSGRLGTDRPHTLKFFGSYELRHKLGSTLLGLNQIAYSGTPDTSTIIYQAAPTLPYGRGDLGRTPTLTQTDLSVKHDFKPTERMTLRFEGNVFNLFNQAAVISRVTQMNRSGAVSGLTEAAFFNGYDPQAWITRDGGAGTAPVNPIYGLPGGSYRHGGNADPQNDRYATAFSVLYPNFGAYQDFRTIRLGLRFIF